MTRTLTTASLLAGGALALQMATAQAAVFDRAPFVPQLPSATTKTLPTVKDSGREHEIRVADIGNWFEQVTPNYDNNRMIQQLDQQFQKLLGDIGNIQGFDRFFGNNIYGPYSHEMEQMALLGGYRYPDLYSESLNGTLNKQIDYCTSTAMENFYRRYLGMIKEFAGYLPHLKKQVPNYEAQIQGIGAALFALKEINEQYRKDMLADPDKYRDQDNQLCGPAVASNDGFSKLSLI